MTNVRYALKFPVLDFTAFTYVNNESFLMLLEAFFLELYLEIQILISATHRNFHPIYNDLHFLYFLLPL